MILNNLKISYKLILLFVIFAFVLIDIGAFGFASVKDMSSNFEIIKNYSIPSLTISSKLKDRTQVAILNAYDYLTADQAAGKEKYEQNIAEAFALQVQLFEITKESADIAFIETLNQDLFDIKTVLDQAMEVYQEDPDSVQIQGALTKSITLRNEIEELLKINIETRIVNQAEIAAEEVTSETDNIFRNLMIAGGVALLILVVLILFIIRGISKPIQKLAAAAEAIGKGNLVTVKMRNKDELGLFAQTFNKMGKDILRAKDALEGELEKTKKLDQQKTEFLSVAAHQLRTPSSGVKWVLDMAVKGDLGKLTADQKKYLGRGLENISRMTHVIDDLLNVARIEEQRFAYQFKKIDFSKLVKDVINDFEGKLKKKKLKLKLNLKPIPQIQADEEKIRMVISNLIDNAILYTLKGYIEISLSKKGSGILFSIKDTGVGIPKDAQDQIFTKFFRAKNILQIHQNGSGLGLYVVKDIVEKHNGKVWFESKEDQGTTFFIELAAKQKKAADASKEIESIISGYKKAPSNYLQKK